MKINNITKAIQFVAGAVAYLHGVNNFAEAVATSIDEGRVSKESAGKGITALVELIAGNAAIENAVR